jgi:hypothetical protein
MGRGATLKYVIVSRGAYGVLVREPVGKKPV